LFLITLLCYLPQEVSADGGIVNKIQNGLDKDTDLEAFVPCVLEEYSDAVCVVTDKVVIEGKAKFHNRSFLIYNVSREGLKKVFQYDQEEYSGLLSIRWVDMSSIMATWATGSGTAITLFRMVNKNIELVLAVGTEFSPEVVDLDGDNIPEVLISHGGWILGKDGQRVYMPVKTSIYKFQKDKYTEVKVVEYQKRFTPLSKH
jgi:hypothetical protein